MGRHKLRQKGRRKQKDAEDLWRKVVKLQWDNKCAMCGHECRTRNVHCHHIIGRNGHDMTRTEPTNGILLCAHCHLHAEMSPHVNPSGFMAWLKETHPNVHKWVQFHRWDSGKVAWSERVRCLEADLAYLEGEYGQV